MSKCISVIIPLYNKVSDVGRSLRSVIRQTYVNFELIVINDGSTDRGPEIVREVDDPRIRLIDQQNAGVSVARNRGVQEAKSDLVAFLDADDEWQPDFLETIMRLHANHPECAVFATNYFFRDVNGTLRQPIYRGGMPSGHWEGVLNNYFEIASQSDPPLWSSAIAVKKEALKAIGGFPVGVTSGEDLLTWARLAVSNSIAYCSRPLATFWLRTADNERPTRVPEEPDTVGCELKKLPSLLRKNKKTELQHYIGWWHKNRASMFLRLGLKEKAKQEVHHMLHYSRKSPRLLLYLLLAFSPTTLTQLLLRGIHVVRMFRNDGNGLKSNR